MEKCRQLSAERLSGRQLAVASVVAGLSPAAELAGAVSWPWLLLWSGCGVALARITLRRGVGDPAFSVGQRTALSILYKVGAVLFAARTLSRAAQRVELSSGGSSELWLLVIFAVPLLWIGWGRDAPFFRMTEILWLAMAVVLALVIPFGLARVEWEYVYPAVGDWKTSLWAACELLTPALFLIPQTDKTEGCKIGEGISWLLALSGVGTVFCLIADGILGRAAAVVPNGFFVAAGLLGKSARCEGLLSALWLLPDLTLAGLLCRTWGTRRWPALGAALAVALALTGAVQQIPRELYGCLTLLIWGATVLRMRGKRKIVAEF